MHEFGRQFYQRLEGTCRELKNQIYVFVNRLVFEGFTTRESLSASEAEKRAFSPMPEGTEWGGDAEYGWFRTSFTVPAAAAGQRVLLMSGLGGEQMIYANAYPVGSIDKEHHEVTLSRAATEGEKYAVLIESYAGHGARLENYGPCPPERRAVPPVPAYQCRIGKSAVCFVNEEAYQLDRDLDVLCKLAQVLPETSLRRQKILEALDECIRAVDFELPPEERGRTYAAGRACLKPVLTCRNGDSAPLMHIFGQSHIDIAWLWPMEETRHKVGRTFANQLALMDEYEEYRFLACEPVLLKMLKERYPELYGHLWEKVRSGQVFADGAFFAECDTNIPSGESLIRQLVLGKRWFRENLGVDSRVAWQPDTFGFSAALPQILKDLDIHYFATQKLLRADPECEKFPYQNFIWEGLDGSTVQAVSFFKNNARVDPVQFTERWEKHRTQQAYIDTLLYPFGFGDGGGGANREMPENVRRMRDIEGCPRCEYGTLEDYFVRSRESAEKNRWVGDLYLSWHRGSYTSQQKTKHLIWQNEIALKNVRFMLCALPQEKRAAWQTVLDACEKTLLIHQFHDIAAGVGIRRVHAEAEKCLQENLERIRSVTEAIVQSAGTDGREVIVNTLSFARHEWITLPGREEYVCLPASAAVCAADAKADLSDTVTVIRTEDGYSLANGFVSFTVCGDGCIEEMLDKRNDIYLQEKGQRMNEFCLYRDVENVYDAWELSDGYEKERLQTVTVTGISLKRHTPAVCEIAICRRIGRSESVQMIRLRAGSARIESDIRINWQETHKLLKVHFGTNILCDNALTGTQFGYIERPCHRSHPYASDRYEVCAQRFAAMREAQRGLALLRGGAFGISFGRGEMNLTLLHAPCVPDDSCDRGENHFAFAVLPFASDFSRSGVVEEAMAFEQPPVTVRGGPSLTLPWVESAMIEAIKPADDGNGIILRMYEHRGTRVKAVLRLPQASQVYACGMNEDIREDLGTGGSFDIPMRPFEIKTLRIIE